MKYVISAMLLVVAVIHLLPLSGVLGGERLTVLYGLPFDDPNLAILMRHRAVSIGLLGMFLLYAAFKPKIQPIAFVAGFISVLSFLWVVYTTGNYNAHIARVFKADIISLVCLAIGSVVYVLARHRAERESSHVRS